MLFAIFIFAIPIIMILSIFTTISSGNDYGIWGLAIPAIGVYLLYQLLKAGGAFKKPTCSAEDSPKNRAKYSHEQSKITMRTILEPGYIDSDERKADVNILNAKFGYPLTFKPSDFSSYNKEKDSTIGNEQDNTVAAPETSNTVSVETETKPAKDYVYPKNDLLD